VRSGLQRLVRPRALARARIGTGHGACDAIPQCRRPSALSRLLRSRSSRNAWQLALVGRARDAVERSRSAGILQHQAHDVSTDVTGTRHWGDTLDKSPTLPANAVRARHLAAVAGARLLLAAVRSATPRKGSRMGQAKQTK